MKYLKNQNGIALKTIIIIVAIVFIGIIIISMNSKPGIEMKADEVVAYKSLRNAIEEAKSSQGMTSILSSENFNILGKMAKNADSSNQWFSQTGKLVLYGNTADSDGYEVSWLSDGTYCAIFYAKKENDKYYLTSYYFDVDDVKGYIILVG